MQKQRLVLIGNGMAGSRAIEEIVAREPERYAITIFGAEPCATYDRIQLSPFLGGERDFDSIMLQGADWYARHRITLHSGEKVVAIDREAREIFSATGRRVPYDILVLATGSLPIMLPVPGAALPGVLPFRTLADVEAMKSAAEKTGKAVVIGGGLLGLEAAYGLKQLGMDATLVHVMPHLMERQLDPVAGAMLKSDTVRRGVKVITNASTEEILGTNHVTQVVLADGRALDADLVVMAVGIRPHVELARAAGLDVNRGVVVDDRLLTSDESIYALGECVEHRGATFGLVAPLYAMARVLAERLCDNDKAFYAPEETATRLKVTGIDLFSAGDINGDEDTDIVMFRDVARGIYKRLVLRGDKLIGTLLYGEVGHGQTYLDLMQARAPIAPQRDALMFSPRSLLAPKLADAAE